MDKQQTLNRLKETAEIKPINEREIGFQVGIKEAISLIEKMEGFNGLSTEWINSHLTDGYNVSMGRKVVYVEDLECLLKADRSN